MLFPLLVPFAHDDAPIPAPRAAGAVPRTDVGEQRRELGVANEAQASNIVTGGAQGAEGSMSRAVEQLEILDRVRVFPDVFVERDDSARLHTEQLLCARRAQAGPHLIRGISLPLPGVSGDMGKAPSGASAPGIANAEEIPIDDDDDDGDDDSDGRQDLEDGVAAPAATAAMLLDPDKGSVGSGDCSDGQDRAQRGEQEAQGGGECGEGGTCVCVCVCACVCVCVCVCV